MSALHARLTLFAVISAMEEDLRGAVLDYLGEHEVPDILKPELLRQCAQRLSTDSGLDAPTSTTLDTLIVYTDLGDLFEILNRNRQLVPAEISAYVSSFTPQLQRIVQVRNRVCHNRPLEFEDFPLVFDLASEFVTESGPGSSFWPRLRETFSRLETEPHFVLTLSIPREDTDTLHHNLPSPDFDETGFLGRRKELADTRRLCEKSPYPVISIIGEGGIGKTALALKVAYELLDSETSPFEAIIWCSSKSSQVTPHDIATIATAIRDSLDLLRAVTSELGDGKAEDPLPELLEYLEHFRVLLVLDNLETVLDERLRSFLQQLPVGSKVLLTSRIGVGAYDFPLKLTPLHLGDSVHLLRALAKSRGATTLVRMPNKDLEAYCNRLKNNPGFIKWFVAAVQSGVRPEDALAKPDVFLQFCMDNVYKHLGDESRALLDVMTITGSEAGLNQSQLHFLSALSPERVQLGLQQLLTTNLVTMLSAARGVSFDTTYLLSETWRQSTCEGSTGRPSRRGRPSPKGRIN